MLDEVGQIETKTSKEMAQSAPLMHVNLQTMLNKLKFTETSSITVFKINIPYKDLSLE